MSSSITESIENLFKFLTPEEQATTIGKLLEANSEQIPSSPIRTTTVKRELDSPDTPYKGRSRKVYTFHHYQS